MKFKHFRDSFAPFLKCAFSLVELMVTLIVISCIISALTPMITKKLKSQGITVGSGGSSGGTADLEFEPDCSKFGADCALCFEDRCAMCAMNCQDGEYVDTPSCTCKSCSIFGDDCQECNSKQCRKCADNSYANGTSCVVCPIGSYCNGVDKITCPSGKYSDVEGATSCKDCEAGYACLNGIKTECAEGTYSEAKSSSCLVCEKGYYCPGISDKIKCDGNKYQDLEGQLSCKDCGSSYYVSDDRTSCNICEAGYMCDGTGVKTQCVAGTYSQNGASSCIKCSAGTYSSTKGATDITACKTCATGKYSSTAGATSCTNCSSKTSYCTKCNASTGVCTECQNGYELNSSKKCIEKTCPTLTMKVKLYNTYYCITKYNIGDNSSFPIPSTVTTVGMKKYCNSNTTKCCWQGETAYDYGHDSANGGYSGYTRTCCNWTAANEACSKLTYNNMSWSLMTYSQMYALSQLGATAVSAGLGTSGLMLCDQYQGYSSAWCASGTTNQSGYTNTFYIFYVWGQKYDSSYYSVLYIDQGVLGAGVVSSNDNSFGSSVRCIAPL